MKLYEVTMTNVATGETFVVEVAAQTAEQAAKKVRGVYGRPGWEVSDVKDTLFRS